MSASQASSSLTGARCRCSRATTQTIVRRGLTGGARHTRRLARPEARSLDRCSGASNRHRRRTRHYLAGKARSRPAAATDAGYTTVPAAGSAAAAGATRNLTPAAAGSAAAGGATRNAAATAAGSAAAGRTGGRRCWRRGRRHARRRMRRRSCRLRCCGGGARWPTLAAAAADRQNKHRRTGEQRDRRPSFRLHPNSPNLLICVSLYPGCPCVKRS